MVSKSPIGLAPLGEIQVGMWLLLLLSHSTCDRLQHLLAVTNTPYAVKSILRCKEIELNLKSKSDEVGLLIVGTLVVPPNVTHKISISKTNNLFMQTIDNISTYLS